MRLGARIGLAAGLAAAAAVPPARAEPAWPVLSGLSIPQRPRAGRPARFSIRPFDSWSRLLGAPRWSFGDGTARRSGNRVVHTYRSAGTYTLTVTQADRLATAAR